MEIPHFLPFNVNVFISNTSTNRFNFAWSLKKLYQENLLKIFSSKREHQITFSNLIDAWIILIENI